MSVDKKFKRFLLIFFCLLGIPVVVVWQAYPYVGRRILSRPVAEADYLESLRNNSKIGCATLLARQPEILLIGNSGSYTMWDARRLQRITGMRVGGCMLGGASGETLLHIMELVRELKTPPKQIILGTNIYMFVDSENRTLQNQMHVALLDEARAPYTFWTEAYLKEMLHKQLFPASAKAQDEAITLHAPRLDACEATIDREIRRHLPKSIEAVKKAQGARRLPDFGKNVADEVCRSVKELGSRLWVVNIPVGPLAESYYTDEVRKYYQMVLDQFGSCAERVVNLKAEEYGLKDKHYVNRYLENVDYDKWRDGNAEKLEYDPDHANPIGAALFTDRAARFLTGGDAGKVAGNDHL